MTGQDISQGKLTQIVISRYIMAIVFFLIIFFLPAGTFNYWEGWVYMAILLFPMLFGLIYLLKKSPELLARRMQFKEKVNQQKWIVGFSYIPLLLAFILPGFDYRWGWSTIPLWIIILGQIMVVVGYGIVLLVFRENQYASRIIEVSQKQTVIDSGPYALVRHPMYFGTMLLYVISPLALGSYWAVIPAVFIIPVLVFRIIDEEKTLARDLEGYSAYIQKTRYRLIPGIW
jgi:protein-S-isoprenylcysteine O-methyltransferase Ste14